MKPGELIVKYKSAGALAVTEDAERWLAEGQSFARATADASPSLDALHRQLGVRRARALVRERRGLSTEIAKQRLAAKSLKLFGPRQAAGLVTSTHHLSELANLYVLTLPASTNVQAAARVLSTDPHVEYAQPNYLVEVHLTTDDPYLSSSGSWGQVEDDLWGIKRAAFPPAWDSAQGEGVIVGVVDTGLDLDHPDIAENVWQNPGEVPGNGLDDDGNGYVDDVNGYNFGFQNNDLTDTYGHGTHVAGTIAAVGNNALGVVGTAPRATIMPINALPEGGNTIDMLALAMLYGIENGARVVNNSWGCEAPCPENPVVEDVVRLAGELGVAVVFSAGNSFRDVRDFSPQNQPGSIVVAASDPADGRPIFSNFGLVDVSAPGGGQFDPDDSTAHRNVLSLLSAECTSFICAPALVVGDGYLRQAGTSMSAPHASGLAALVLAQHPEYSPEQVRQAIRHAADDVGPAGYDADSGYGRIDAARTLAETTPVEALITGPAVVVLQSSAPIAVTGKASGPGFAAFRLDYAPSTASDGFTLLANSTTPVADGTLATLNPASLFDGDYALRLQVTTTDGRVYEDRHPLSFDRVVITDPPPYDPDSWQLPIPPFFRAGVPIAVRGTVAPGGFKRYRLSILKQDGTPLLGANVTLVRGGRFQVENGLLGTWYTTGVPTGTYSIVVEVTGANGEVITESVRVTVDPTLHPGWPVQIEPVDIETEGTVPFADELTAADLNGDGAVELAFGYGSQVSVFTHTGAQLPGWPQSIDPEGEGTFMRKSPAVADVTGDSGLEVIAANDAGELFVWSRDGRLLVRAPDAQARSVAVEDVDGDGANDIVTTNLTGQLRISRIRRGKLVTWFERTFPDYPSLSPPAIGDIDGDGDMEFALAAAAPNYYGNVTQLYVIDRKGVLPGWPKLINDGTAWGYDANPTLGDVDGDGRLDVAMSAYTGSVSVFRPNGQLLPGWPQATVASFANTPTLGDFDGNGRLDVLVGTGYVFDDEHPEYANGTFFAFRSNGARFANFPRFWHIEPEPTSGMGAFGFGSAALADLDGDGGVEAIVSSDADFDPTHALQAFRPNGSMLPGFPKTTGLIGAYSTNTPAIADFDGDHKLELAFIDMSGLLFIWDLDAPASAERPWPMFAHDAQHTGRTDACRPRWRSQH